MSYFNYHAKAKKLIKEGELVKVKFIDDYNGIKSAMVLFFKNNRPMPIREARWQEYFAIIKNIEDFINDES